ncbi:cathelicidin-2 [Pogona vitticeps]
MQSYWALLVLFAGAVVAAPTPQAPASYEQVVAAAVDTYNQQQKPEYAFRLLEAEPQTDWQTSGETTQPLKFSIKETVCRSSETPNVSQCDYKDDGVDRDCSGFYSTQQKPPTIIIQCEDVDQELQRITRGRWSRWRNKAKRFIKKHGVSIALAALRFG